MIRTIHTIRDKVIKTVKKLNKNKSSRYFGKEFVILECENNKILVQKDKELISDEDLSTVFENNILLGKSSIFSCIKVRNDFILTSIDKIGD